MFLKVCEASKPLLASLVDWQLKRKTKQWVEIFFVDVLKGKSVEILTRQERFNFGLVIFLRRSGI